MAPTEFLGGRPHICMQGWAGFVPIPARSTSALSPLCFANVLAGAKGPPCILFVATCYSVTTKGPSQSSAGPAHKCKQENRTGSDRLHGTNTSQDSFSDMLYLDSEAGVNKMRLQSCRISSKTPFLLALNRTCTRKTLQLRRHMTHLQGSRAVCKRIRDSSLHPHVVTLCHTAGAQRPRLPRRRFI